VNLRHSFVLATAALPCLASAQSDELFFFEVTADNNPNNSIVVGRNSLPDLAFDLASGEGDFTSFRRTPFTALLNYAGAENAIEISRFVLSGSQNIYIVGIRNIAGSDGTSVTLIGTPDSLGEQLQDFFLKDNPDIIKDFLAAIAEQSVVSVTDGNPLASTARSAKFRFNRFGMFSDASPASNQINRMFASPIDPGLPGEDEQADDDVPRMELGSAMIDHGGFLSRIDFTGQTVSADGFDGSSFDINFSSETRLTDRVSLAFGVPIGYHTIEGADVFNVGLHVDAPINIMLIEENAKQGFSWTLTPGVSAEGVVSYDFAAGGTLYSLGLTNAFRYDYDKFTFIAAQQITWHESTELDVDEYTIDPGVEQQILKLGGKVVYRFTDGAAVYAGGTWTDFLEEAAVDNYVTPVAGVAWQLKNGAHISLGYEGDFGDDYESHGGRLTFQLPF
jgi:hypothetical protein